MVDIAGFGKSTEGQDSAYWEEVKYEAGSCHVGLNFLQLGHGIAGFHCEKSWVGDGETAV